MGQIYSALAYYCDNKALVDRQIQEAEEYADKLLALIDPNYRADKMIEAKRQAVESA